MPLQLKLIDRRSMVTASPARSTPCLARQTRSGQLSLTTDTKSLLYKMTPDAPGGSLAALETLLGS